MDNTAVTRSENTKIKNHYDNWKISINTAKTEAILLIKSVKILRLQDTNKISLCGKEIEWKKSAKYLGVRLNNKLLFKKNIEKNIFNAKKVMATLYGLLKKIMECRSSRQ